MNNGGDYVAARRALLSRYVVPWLLALHNLDEIAYPALLYETVVHIQDDFLEHDINPNKPDIHEKVTYKSAD